MLRSVCRGVAHDTGSSAGTSRSGAVCQGREVQAAGIQRAQLANAAHRGGAGLLGSSWLESSATHIYADFDEEAMGINLGQMRIRVHYWLSERKAVDEVAAKLQDGMRCMVQGNLESATGEQLKWSKAGFPTLTNVAPLAGDVCSGC